MDLIGLLIHLLVLALVGGLIYWVVTIVAAQLPAPAGNIVRVIATVILVLILIYFLLGEFGGIGGPYYSHRHRL